MTFDDAFDAAMKAADVTTVEGKPETWGQRFRFRSRPRWRPTIAERSKAYEAAKQVCLRRLATKGELPRDYEVREAMRDAVSMWPLTLLWIISTVISLMKSLREWRERHENSPTV